MAKILHKFFKAFRNHQRVVLILLFMGVFGAAGVAVLKASFAASTSTINGYKVDQTGQWSSTQPAIANIPVEYTCCTLSSNKSPQPENPYVFDNLPQGAHQVSIYSANIPAGWVPFVAHCWEDGSCPKPAPTAMAYEGHPHNRYTYVLDNSVHSLAHVWFHFRQNPPGVSVSVSPPSVAYGGSTTVTWNSSNTTNNASCSNNFNAPGNPKGSSTIGNLTATRSFKVTCTNTSGSASDEKSVAVGAKPNPPVQTPSNPPSSGGSSGGSPGSPASRPLQGSSNNNQGAPAPVADTTPPTSPANFLVEADEDKPLINLSWDTSSDAIGIKGYQLERSTDQQTWVTVIQDTPDVFYEDNDLKFATHYYYRIKAVDTSNNASEYAMTDTTTAGFQSNISKDEGGTITSEDNLASVAFPAGVFEQDAYCGLVNERDIGGNVSGFELISGPYQLSCQAADGTLLTDLKSPATASITIDAKQRKRYSTVRYYTKDGDNWQQVLGSSDNFELSHTNSFALYGKRKTTPIWVKIIIVLLVLVGLAILVIGFLYIRYRRSLQAKADDYYRKSKGFQ